MAKIIAVADAVVDLINGSALPHMGSALAVRKYVPVNRVKDLVDLRVTVVPTELSATQISRRDHDFDYVIDVGIQQRFPGEPGAENADDANDIAFADDLMQFAEDLIDLFRGKRLDGLETARCELIENAPVFSAETYNDDRVFTSVVRLTFRVARPITP